MMCNVNDTVQFRYYGGSRYGGWRKLKVSEVTVDKLGGVDLDDDNKFKRFDVDKMTSFMIVEKGRTATDELADLQAFVLKNPSFGKVMVSEYNKKHGTKLEWKGGKLVLPKTKATVTATIDVVANTITFGSGFNKVVMRPSTAYDAALKALVESV